MEVIHNTANCRKFEKRLSLRKWLAWLISASNWQLKTNNSKYFITHEIWIYIIQVPTNFSFKKGLKANINYDILHLYLHISKKVFHVLRFNFFLRREFPQNVRPKARRPNLNNLQMITCYIEIFYLCLTISYMEIIWYNISFLYYGRSTDQLSVLNETTVIH